MAIPTRQSTSLAAALTHASDCAPSAPAAAATARVSRAILMLGAAGVASAIFVVVRLPESWGVGPQGTHRLAFLGQRLSYPSANVDAVVVLVLAALGAVVTARALAGAVREARAYRRLQRVLAGAVLDAGLGALMIVDEQPRAFCGGWLHPKVYVSTGAVARLDRTALEAVVAHERHHARSRDPLRLAAGRVLARALFFVPNLGALVLRQQSLAELSADEAAVNAAPDNRSALARAMLSFSDAPAGGAAGFDPARVDYLLGESPSWRFPALLCLAAASVVALLITVALLVGRAASGSATLALPFLSSQPCVVLLAAIPVVAGTLAANRVRRVQVRTRLGGARRRLIS